MNGVKGDQDKPPIYRGVLCQFPKALLAVSTISNYGALKYSWDNWKHVPDGVERYTNALTRHLVREAAGEIVDVEAGLPHAYSIAWNALARLELMLIEEEQK